ncbi:asparagine synthase-related protein [Xanthomarina spongicola]|uniref:asparagine synthase (glutamine-hydrolyzing) n=1 Tax=Xanthomarina spongicola TaxID=570520 RepID=A0A316DIB9_9FLAO|nr:asparagine synthase C-terminal domain-containing protein [Xanthomarina spongicola]PWK18007.1 asparagine synthase [Xanthomarina spongicola]
MNSHNVHAFSGVIGETNNVSQSFLDKYQVLINQPNIKLFITQNVPSHYYNVDDTSFLWTGGSKAIKDNLTFDYTQEDSKFVYIKFVNNVYSIVSDHYSKIPLLYVKQGNTIYFSTSLKFLLEICNSTTLDINYNGLSVFYHYGVNSFEQGLIRNLKLLSGGSLLTYSNESISISKYFDITKLKTNWRNTKRAHENTLLIDDILLRSTTKTVQNYDSIGIALSGGVDSGYLAQKISESKREFSAYTIGYEDGYNEFERIDYLANILKFKTEKIILSPKEIIDNYLKVSAYSSFPLGFNNSILNFIYKKAASDGVDVLFDGDGADRLFLGMNKFLQLRKFLKFYNRTKVLKLNSLTLSLLKMVNHPSGKKLQFYFKKLNHGIPFYGERILSDKITFDSNFEVALNDLILPNELKNLDKNIDKWLFFSLFSIYYTPTFFFHTPYELQLKHGLVSNPEFWSDEMVQLALSIPTEQKLYNKTTKKVLRDAAKIKIDNGYWGLTKIGLQNSYKYIKTKDFGKDFINSYVELVKRTDEYHYLVENTPDGDIDPERLIRYYIWKENMFQS